MTMLVFLKNCVMRISGSGPSFGFHGATSAFQIAVNSVDDSLTIPEHSRLCKTIGPPPGTMTIRVPAIPGIRANRVNRACFY